MQHSARIAEIFLSFLIILNLTHPTLHGASTPITYNAVTDMLPRGPSYTPKLGRAGSIVNDPDFGTRILRVTDQYSMPGFTNQSFQTPSGGFMNNWNADNTIFWIHAPNGTIFYNFNASTMQATRFGDTSNSDGGLVVYQMAVGPFSYRLPNIVYGVSGMKIMQYDIQSNTFATLFNGNNAVPGATGYAYSVSVSDDDTKFAYAIGGDQDTYPYVIHWDRSTGRTRILNTVKSTVDGQPTNIWLGFGVHSTAMDRTGRFVIICKGLWRTVPSPDFVVWDTQTGTVAEITPEGSGHQVSGFGYHVNQSGLYYEPQDWYDAMEYRIRHLGSLTDTRLLIDPLQLPTPHLYSSDGHLSWNNARADALVPVLATAYRDVSEMSKPPRALEGEIFALRTDGASQTVWRFAHHFSYFDGNNFWDTPRGNVSQDGRWYVFTSNWQRTLGTDPSTGMARQDVFIVELPAGQTIGSSSSSGTTTPPSTQVTSGPVRINAGGSSYTDSQGNTWVSDTGYAGGSTFSTASAIQNTSTPKLYQTERYGTFSYNFAVANGTHAVNLRFAEIYFSSPGQRVFNVAINGNTVLANFDIVAAAGAAFKAVDRQFQVNVTNGQLAIQFTSIVDQAKVSAIEIDVPASGSSTQTSGSSASGTTINAGGAYYADPQGIAWAADTGFSGGSTFSTGSGIAGTATPEIYKTERFGDFSYQLSVPNGFHTVRLKFAEIYFTTKGSRVFNVFINGQQVLNNFDIVAAAGGGFTAIDKDFGVQVGNGQIRIDFISVVNNAKVSAIQIDPLAALVANNSGGGAYTDPNGRAWTADANYSGGAAFTTGSSIGGTTNPKLYQSERFGALTYQFNVPNGTRTVRLKFAEIYFTSPGSRVFHVNINGARVLTNFDIVAAGGAFAAVDRQFAVPVSNGVVTIQLVPVIENPKISGIEIE